MSFNCEIEEFIANNRDEFKTTLLREAVKVAPNIHDMEGREY